MNFLRKPFTTWAEQAIDACKIDNLRRYVRMGADLKTLAYKIYTCAEEAAERKESVVNRNVPDVSPVLDDMGCVLVEAGLDPHTRYHSGQTVFQMFACVNMPRTMAALSRRGADYATPCTIGRTAFMWAVFADNMPAARDMIAQEKVFLTPVADKPDFYCWMDSVRRKNSDASVPADIVEAVIEHPSARDYMDDPRFFTKMVSWTHDAQLLARMIDMGATVESDALYAAIARGSTDVCDVIIDKGGVDVMQNTMQTPHVLYKSALNTSSVCFWHLLQKAKEVEDERFDAWVLDGAAEIARNLGDEIFFNLWGYMEPHVHVDDLLEKLPENGSVRECFYRDKLAQASAARPADGQYTVLSGDVIARADGGGMKTIFNFNTGKILTTLNDQPVEQVQNFNDVVRQESIVEAYNALLERGGNPPPVNGLGILPRKKGFAKDG